MSMLDWAERWKDLEKVYRQRSLHIHNWRIADINMEKQVSESSKSKLVPYDRGTAKSANPKPPAIVVVEPPASETEIIKIEKEMGCSIPFSFRNVIKTYSRKVDVSWMFPYGEEEYRTVYDGRFRNFSWGILYWSLDELPQLQKEFQTWLTDCYDDPSDSYGRHWYGKFAVCEVGCGDYTVIESENNHSEQVIYLSHDGDTTVNGFPLGQNFEDYVDRMSYLGCPSEGFSLYPFMKQPLPYIQIDNENTRLWRLWFGLGNK